ncbi:Predicted membrane protein [Ceraceosorus bombacis]|uniref:Golgi apparatus membrane protein TVP38 n=1 Tax=Ceraceosorus bombacis TaxID=401625 RepID=A0A0P1BHM5_9BASI|nr:Predicted membrane protein [Ceraceosorus bombacis]
MPSSRRQQTHAWRTAGSGTNSRFGEATFRSLLSPGWWIAFAQRLFQSSIEWWKAATLRARLAVFALGAMYGGLALTALILGPEKIASLLGGLASQISASSQGKLYLLSALVILSIPPLPGYGSAVTLCGLAYGSASIEPKGTHGLFEAWTLAAVGCLLGASIAFALLRFIVKGPGKSWQVITNVTDDRRWNAVQLAIRDKGLAMVVLIRFSPFPFCYSNLFFASMESVSFFQFLVATAMITPKLLLHCFVGARTRELLDSGARQELDWHARMLNIAYILGGSAIGAATGWFVWRETQAILSTYDAEEGLEGSLEADSSPMLGSRRGSVRRARPDRGRVDGPNPQPTQSSGASRPDAGLGKGAKID